MTEALPVRLTPTQALTPDTIERLAAAEFIYGEIMAGRLAGSLRPWRLLSEAERNEWRAKARELLTDLVNDTT